MKPRNIFLILIVLLFVPGLVKVAAAPPLPPPDAYRLPYDIAFIDKDEDAVTNLSVALVGLNEIPFISYTKTSGQQILWAHLATAAVPGNCASNTSWACHSIPLLGFTQTSLSNVATRRYGLDTFGMAWAFKIDDAILGYKGEFYNDVRLITSTRETLIDVDKFGGTLVGAPSIELVGDKFRLAAVFLDSASTTYQLVFLHFVGGSNTSCRSVASGYQCDVIEVSEGTALGAPILGYDAGNDGIAYTMGNAIRYAYPWEFQEDDRLANCHNGGGFYDWRCIDIIKPSPGTIGDLVALAYGSDGNHAAIAYSYKPLSTDMLMRAVYVGSGGNCGHDGYDPGLIPIFRWNCGTVDASIEDINQTTFAVTLDPYDYPVFSWNNKSDGDLAQRLYISYPAERTGVGSGWIKQVIDGNDWSSTGKWNDIAISNTGLTFLGYMQPWYRACGEMKCIIDNSDNLKAALQRFKSYLPVINK